MIEFAPDQFAREWIAAWNRSDVETVLAHFAEETVFVSPLAAKVTGNPELGGKAALRAYWMKALSARSAPLQFRLDSFTWDQDHRALLIVYVSIESGDAVRKCELMHFAADGLIHRGEAFAGATV